MTEGITQTKDSQLALTADAAINLLQNGNERFVNNKPIHRDFSAQVQQTSTGQFPFASVVSCIDSRIPTEIIFDQGIGDIFNARIAGNFINKDILGSLEFACKLAGSKVIVIMGHTSCGAVKGACDFAELGNLTDMLANITPALDYVKTDEGVDRSSSNLSFVNDVAVENVKLNMLRLKKESPVLNEMIENNEVVLVGAMYDVATGKVAFI